MMLFAGSSYSSCCSKLWEGGGKATSVILVLLLHIFSKSLFLNTAVSAVGVKHKCMWCWQDKEDGQ